MHSGVRAGKEPDDARKRLWSVSASSKAAELESIFAASFHAFGGSPWRSARMWVIPLEAYRPWCGVATLGVEAPR